MEPVAHWHAEHANVRRLLDILQKQLDTFHEGGQPNYELMLDIVTYLHHFSDRFHHPREDLAFARLARHDPKMRIALNRLRQEHRVIAAAGEDLRRDLTEVIAGTLVARASVEAAAAVFLVYYRHHIAFEDQEVLPRAAELLTAEDWAAVAAVVPHGTDPLFGKRGGEGYRELRHHIAVEARGE